jgi:hypothetical protein
VGRMKKIIEVGREKRKGKTLRVCHMFKSPNFSKQFIFVAKPLDLSPNF